MSLAENIDALAQRIGEEFGRYVPAIILGPEDPVPDGTPPNTLVLRLKEE